MVSYKLQNCASGLHALYKDIGMKIQEGKWLLI